MCKTLSPKAKLNASESRMDPRRKAALNPGIQEFEEIVVLAIQLRNRVTDFLREHDEVDSTSDMLSKLEIATRSEMLDYDYASEIMRDLWAMEYTLRATTTNIVPCLPDGVFPRAMEADRKA